MLNVCGLNERGGGREEIEIVCGGGVDKMEKIDESGDLLTWSSGITDTGGCDQKVSY